MTERIALCIKVMALVDEYHEQPSRGTRQAIRSALMDEWAPAATLTAGSQAVQVPADKAQAARHEIGKWLNEGQLSEINRQALAELCAGFDQLERSGQVPGWRPIETAPKGQKVLLYRVAIDRICVDDWGLYDVYNQPKFTHWMPLPAAPLQPLAGGEVLG